MLIRVIIFDSQRLVQSSRFRDVAVFDICLAAITNYQHQDRPLSTACHLSSSCNAP